MTEVNSMYRAQTRSDDLKAQIEKLRQLVHMIYMDDKIERYIVDLVGRRRFARPP